MLSCALVGAITSHSLEGKQVFQANEVISCWNSEGTTSPNYFLPMPCHGFYHPFCLYEAREKEGGRNGEKGQRKCLEVYIPGILTSLINLLLSSCTFQKRKCCEEPDLREATERNGTFGITSCANEILVSYWIPRMVLLSQPCAGRCIQVTVIKAVPMSPIFLYSRY